MNDEHVWRLERIPAMGLNDCADNFPTALGRHRTFAGLQFLAWHREDAVAFAQCCPIETVCGIEQYFTFHRRTRVALRSTVENFHKILPRCACRM